MPFDSIPSAWVQVGEPTKQELLQRIKDNEDALYGDIATVGGLQVPNGSFEVDSDSDGVPDLWSVSYYPGGSGALETTDPIHGETAWKFVHPGGSGNGGGYIDSDYVPISESVSPLIQLMLKCSVAGVRVMVQLRYFDKGKVFISSEDIYDSTSNPTSWTDNYLFGLPPANARYAVVRLIGGESTVDVAGDVFFDWVRFDPSPDRIRTFFTITEAGTGTGSFVDVANISLTIPKGFKYLNFPGTIRGTAPASNGIYTQEARARIGATYSPSIKVKTGKFGGQPWEQENEGTLCIDVSVISGAQTLYLQAKAGGDSSAAYIRKDQNMAEFIR